MMTSTASRGPVPLGIVEPVEGSMFESAASAHVAKKSPKHNHPKSSPSKSSPAKAHQENGDGATEQQKVEVAHLTCAAPQLSAVGTHSAKLSWYTLQANSNAYLQDAGKFASLGVLYSLEYQQVSSKQTV